MTLGTIFEAGGLLLGFDFSENLTRYPEIIDRPRNFSGFIHP